MVCVLVTLLLFVNCCINHDSEWMDGWMDVWMDLVKHVEYSNYYHIDKIL